MRKIRLSRAAVHAGSVTLLLLALAGGPAEAQEPRYSWFEIGLLSQDTPRTGTLVPVPGQTVDVATKDGEGVRFRGSIGDYAGFYGFFDYGAVDATVEGLVTNVQGQFPATDEFDLTTIRGGVGYRWAINFATHIVGEISYDSLDYDFGSFAGEDFDTGDQGFGALLRVRRMVGDDLELSAYTRYTSVGDVQLNTQEVDADTLFGVSASYMFIRGLSLTLDYETGEIDSWSAGFRLDLDED